MDSLASIRLTWNRSGIVTLIWRSSWCIWFSFECKKTVVSMISLFLLTVILIASRNATAEGEQNTINVAFDASFSSMWDGDIFSAVKSFTHLASKKYLQRGGLSVTLVEDESFMFMKGENELVILLTIVPCNSTWLWYHQLKSNNILQVSITEPNCPRLPIMKGLTIPLINSDEQISQVILDLRSENVLHWKEAIIIYDDSISSYLRDRIVKVLSDEISDGEGKTVSSVSTAILKLDDSERENTMQTQFMQLFKIFSVSRRHVNFLGFLKPENMRIVLEMGQHMGLMHTQNQWLFYLTGLKRNITTFAPLVNEGGNVAFLYTTTKMTQSRSNDDEMHSFTANKGRGDFISFNEKKEGQEDNLLLQEVGHLIFMLVKSMKQLKDAEYELSSRVSKDEWKALKPTVKEQRNALLSYLKENVKGEVEGGEEAVEWRAAAVESWGLATGELPTIFNVANWIPRVGLVSWDHIFPHVRHGFRRKHIRVATFHQPPWHTIYLNESGSIVGRKGLFFDVLDELARTLNFSYTLVYQQIRGNGIIFDPKKQAYPPIAEKPQNHSVLADQVIQVVGRRKALLGAAAFVSSARLGALVNTTGTVATERHCFLTSRPQVLSRALIFMAPFSTDTWLCIAFSILLIGPVLHWVHRMSPYYEFHGLRHKRKLTSKAKKKFSVAIKLTAFDKLWKCVWYVYGALLQQGGIQVPLADSGRIVIGTWWLVVIVVMTTYCGNLVAFLTFPSVSSTISNLHQLMETLRSGDAVSGEHMSLGIIDEAVDKVNLKEASDSRLRFLSSMASVHGLSVRDTNRSAERRVLDRVRRGKHVLIARLSHLLLLAEVDYLNNKRCDFHLGRETFLDENLVMIVAKNSPYLNIIDEEIKKMHQGGLIQKWIVDSLPKKGLCKDKFHERSGGDSAGSGSEKAKNREVKLDDMQGSFFVLFIGCFLAFVTITLECAWKRRDAIREKLAI